MSLTITWEAVAGVITLCASAWGIVYLIVRLTIRAELAGFREKFSAYLDERFALCDDVEKLSDRTEDVSKRQHTAANQITAITGDLRSTVRRLEVLERKAEARH